MNKFDFDKNFERTNKTINRTFCAIVVVWIVGVIVSLAALGGLAYVAFHFIQKLW